MTRKNRPEYVAVEYDEKRHYNFTAPEDMRFIKAIWTTYVFDRNEATHLAEITPSYYLAFAHTELEFYDRDLVNDRLVDKLYDRYVHEVNQEDGIYMHCRDVDRYCKSNPKHCKVLGEYDSIDDAVEDVNANYPF